MCKIVTEYRLCPCIGDVYCKLARAGDIKRFAGTDYYIFSQSRKVDEGYPCRLEAIRQTGSDDKTYPASMANPSCPDKIDVERLSFKPTICIECSDECYWEKEPSTDGENTAE